MMRGVVIRGVVICILAAVLPALPALAQDPSPLAPYPSCEEALTEIRELAAAYPDRAAVVEIGRSVGDRPVLAGLDQALELTGGQPLPAGAKPGRPESQVIIYPRTPVP